MDEQKLGTYKQQPTAKQKSVCKYNLPEYTWISSQYIHEYAVTIKLQNNKHHK